MTPNGAPPRISVVVPAFNEEAYIGATLDSIGRAANFFRRATGRELEVIVVDNDSGDRTAEIAAQKGARVVREPYRQIARVRNRGAAEAQGEILVTCDADNHLTENMFVRIDEVMSSGRYIGGGVRIFPDEQRWGIKAILAVFDFFADLTGLSFGVFYTMRETFFRVGGFSEDVYVGEDALFAIALKREGRRRGLKFSNLKDAYIVTSMRKMNEFGVLGQCLTFLKFALMPWVIRRRESCPTWYEVRKPSSEVKREEISVAKKE